MTPHKQRRGKSFRIDRSFVGVGRIALSSGTDHAGTFRRINAALTGISRIGRLDVLMGVKEGRYAPLVVLYHYERGQLDKLPTAETSAGLVPALRHFAETHECGVSYRADLWTSVRHVERTPGAKTAAVADLSRILRAIRERMRVAKTPVAFNRLRAHLLSFASVVQGELTPLWLEVKRVKRFKKAEGRRPRTVQRRPLTVAELDLVCAAFVDVPVYGGKRNGGKSLRYTITATMLAETARSLAYTGMRPAEYWERHGADWSERGTYIWVEGTKTSAARRPTFAIDGPYTPRCGEQFFRRQFTAATVKALRVGLDAYSLRRTFAKLCEDAGVVPSRKDAYMGHGPKTVSDLYLVTNVLPFVAGDAELVRTWIAAERTRAATSSQRLEVMK